MSDISSHTPSENEGPWSTFVAALFIISLFACLLAGMCLVVLQIAALCFGSANLSVRAEAILSPISGVGASMACVTSLVYFWCHRRSISE